MTIRIDQAARYLCFLAALMLVALVLDAILTRDSSSVGIRNNLDGLTIVTALAASTVSVVAVTKHRKRMGRFLVFSVVILVAGIVGGLWIALSQISVF